MRLFKKAFPRTGRASRICSRRGERKLLAGSDKRLRGFYWSRRENAMTEIENVAFAAQLAEDLSRRVHDIFVRPEQNGRIEISL